MVDDLKIGRARKERRDEYSEELRPSFVLLFPFHLLSLELESSDPGYSKSIIRIYFHLPLSR